MLDQTSRKHEHKYLLGITDNSIEVSQIQYHDQRIVCRGDFPPGEYQYLVKVPPSNLGLQLPLRRTIPHLNRL